MNAVVGARKALFRVFRTCNRCFVPASYRCTELWNSRLLHDAFNNQTGRDNGRKIIQKIKSNMDVSALEYDVFANQVHEFDSTSLDFVEIVMKDFLKTQTSIIVCDSTSHSFVRGYIDFQEEDRLLDLIKKRSETGIFLDFASATFLMNVFLRKERWDSAVDVAWELCLQEYFSSDFELLPFATALYSCVNFIKCGTYTQLTAISEGEEDEEIDYRFVPYVRNPNYDGFFDITRSRLKAGGVLLDLANALSSHTEPFKIISSVWSALHPNLNCLYKSLLIFGLALSEKFDSLAHELSKLTDSNLLMSVGLCSEALSHLEKIISCTVCRPDNEPMELGKYKQPTQFELNTVEAELKRIRALGERGDDGSLNIALSLINNILDNNECMDSEVKSVSKLYSKFMQDRHESWTKLLESLRRTEVIKSTKNRLSDLLAEEERLNYFKDIAVIDFNAWLAPRTRKERCWSRLKEWRKDIASAVVVNKNI